MAQSASSKRFIITPQLNGYKLEVEYYYSKLNLQEDALICENETLRSRNLDTILKFIKDVLSV